MPAGPVFFANKNGPDFQKGRFQASEVLLDFLEVFIAVMDVFLAEMFRWRIAFDAVATVQPCGLLLALFIDLQFDVPVL